MMNSFNETIHNGIVHKNLCRRNPQRYENYFNHDQCLFRYYNASLQ